MSECVFCTRHDQPAALFETAGLYVMPDKFPMGPGHVLIVSRAHLACYAAAAAELLAELEETAARVRRFLGEAYGGEILAWENGISGQTVHHAHLHLLPTPGMGVPAEVDGAELIPIDGWEPVRAHYRRHGCYRYAEFGRERRLIAGHSPVLARMRDLWEKQFSVRWGEDGWIKPTTPEDVREAGHRWARWVGVQAPGSDAT